jgi:crotonobetainyl-CoA:carnitine CoA-transferase CaiB-like acyl-CoA transferase
MTQPYPFAGLRVLDFGIGAAGVEAGRFFAEWGADVIKVESTAQLDFLRVTVGTMMNPLFASSNRSKRSLGLNVRNAEGLALVERLVEHSDVLIENSRTSAMERLGLGWDRVRELNPRLVMLSSQLLGSGGPWREWAGFGPNVGAVAGLTYLWNHPEDGDPPVGVSTIYPDHLIGRLLALAGTAALLARERTGVGMHAEVAQFEAVIGMMGDVFVADSLAPGTARPQGNTRERGVPWGVYPAAGDDAWIAVTVRDDEEWGRLAAVIGEAEWLAPELATATGRAPHRDEIDARLTSWTAERDARAAMEELQSAGITCGAVQTAADQLEDSQMLHRGFLRRVRQPDLGEVVFEGPAFAGDALPAPIVQPAPRLGEHTREICREVLGLSDDDIEALLRRGILEEQEGLE